MLWECEQARTINKQLIGAKTSRQCYCRVLRCKPPLTHRALRFSLNTEDKGGDGRHSRVKFNQCPMQSVKSYALPCVIFTQRDLLLAIKVNQSCTKFRNSIVNLEQCLLQSVPYLLIDVVFSLREVLLPTCIKGKLVMHVPRYILAPHYTPFSVHEE